MESIPSVYPINIRSLRTIDVGQFYDVAFDSTLVASERIAFSADRLDSLRLLKERGGCRPIAAGGERRKKARSCHSNEVLN